MKNLHEINACILLIFILLTHGALLGLCLHGALRTPFRKGFGILAGGALVGALGDSLFLFFHFFHTAHWYFANLNLQTAVWLTVQILEYSQAVIVVVGMALLVRQIRQHFATPPAVPPGGNPFQKKTW